LDCLRLSKFAPKEAREEIEGIISSNGKYLDLALLHRRLESKDFSSKFEAKDFLDQEKLLRDVHDGTALK
jgi:hypothetical protein